MKSIVLVIGLIALAICFGLVYFGACRIAARAKNVFHYDESEGETHEVVVQISAPYADDKIEETDGLNCATDTSCGTIDIVKGNDQVK